MSFVDGRGISKGYVVGGVTLPVLRDLGIQVDAGEMVAIIGASGAVAGVLGAYLALFPGRTVISLVGFWLLPVPAFIFLGLWFVGQFMVEVPGVAWLVWPLPP